jgi:hypothetical protein
MLDAGYWILDAGSSSYIGFYKTVENLKSDIPATGHRNLSSSRRRASRKPLYPVNF